LVNLFEMECCHGHVLCNKFSRLTGK